MHFNRDKAGLPIKEPWFGTYYWVEDLSTEMLELWNALASPQMPPPDSMISLPPKNPFVPTNFEIKPTPTDDTNHPLLHCLLNFCITDGKRKVTFSDKKCS